ncbi:MAG TPA: hypothetical protein PKD74_03010 [Candidatus Dependentiae bacterium]|nr:hypothetical protein [Candidatus Dependentiae bacterium]
MKITDCTFSKNSSSNNGGAIWNARALTITGSTFSENSATNYGGAIYHYATDLASCTISCCRFAGNTAANGDALYNTSPSYYVITATNNWWGSNNPDFGSLLFGAITYAPYITMSTVAKPQVIGETGTITVEFASSGTTCTIPTAPIEFTMTDGSVTPTQTTVIDGMASASFIVSASSARVCAQVDDEQLCIDVGPIIVDLYGTYTNIQAAVNAADTNDAICLMVGQIFTGIGNFNVDLQNKNLAFASTNTLLQAQIDLNQLGRLFTVDSGYTVTMQNLDIANGKISGAGVFGAIIENNGNLVLSNCRFRNSIIDNVGYGGAISNTGNLTGLNCEFTDNYATRGGAIANYYILSLSDCTFSNNQAVAGGAIELYANSQVSVLGCTFNSNEVTHYGGAIYSDANADVLFSCNRFVNNVAGVSGPAVYNNKSYTVSFENNWWGTNNPSSSLFVGNVDYTPYLTMSTTAKRKALGETGTITVDFTKNGTCTIPDTTITFTATDGIVTPTQATIIDGTASASFVASNTLARVCAQVDNEEECNDVGPIVVDLYGTYTNIQAAVDAANDDDTIYLTADQIFTGTGNFNIEITKNLTFDRIGTGANPIIDLNYQGRLFGIYPDCTVTMNNLEVRNGYVDGLGGVVLAEGNLNATDCIFIGNTATSIGGALAVAGLNVTGCTFIGNSATNYSGGAIYAGNGIVSCSRFAGNTAPVGSAVTAEITVTATNNWWGTNSPSSSLFSGNVIYDPYIIMSFSASPTTITPGAKSFIDLTFSSTCIPSTPVGFSTTEGTLTSTLANTVDGIVTSTITASYSGLAFTLSATAGPGAENYSLTLTLTPSSVVSNILLTKNTLPSTVDRAGQLISYTYTVSNAGNVYLNDVSLTDNKVIPTFNPPNPLNPGVVATGTASYTVLQSDMDAGFVTNEATATGTTASGDLVTVNTTQTVNATQTPGISILKKINNSSVSTQEPGIVVASDSTMDISYLITNDGNVTLAVEITDDQVYDITPSTTTLVPDASITCTAQTNAPGINELHKNIGTATGTTTLSTVVTASASAYATSIPVNPYRFNFGCICTDTGEEHILIGSHNMPTLDSNTLDCWLFDEGPTATANMISSVDIGSQIIMDSATYNTDAGMNIAVLTQTEAGDTAIVLVTYDGTATIRSTTPLSSRAFKAQWFVASSGTPYIVTDEQNGMSLYEVNLVTYELTLRSSVPNLGAGYPSAFLRWYPQGDSLYVIQGYNQTSVATYKVDLTVPEIQSGAMTDMNDEFIAIFSCTTCYEDLVLGGAGNEEEGLLTRCEIGLSGELTITQTASLPDTTVVSYCERCCCNNNPILVGTGNGLYSLNATTLDTVASNTSMPNNVWINTCWCCDVTGDYCLAVNSNHETFVFQQVGSALNMMIELPN